MSLLVVSVIVWWATHLLPVLARPARNRMAARIGEGPYKGLYALLTVAVVALMVIAYQRAPFVELWSPPGWTVHLNNLLMLIAVAVFIAGTFRSSLTRFIRHPQLAGVKIWAFAHLLVNGDLASVILFGGLLGWAVVAMIGLNKRDGKGPRKPHGTLVANLLNVVVAVGVFGVVTLVHNWAGIWPFPN